MGNRDEAAIDGTAIIVRDSEGVPISIGEWIQAGEKGRPRQVVGIGINRFHGPMVMLDDPITGQWACVTQDTVHSPARIGSWEELVDAAAAGRLPKELLVEQAERLAEGKGN